MTATQTRLVGAVVGAVTMLGAGLLMGGWWWIAALVGALAAAGSVADRQLAHAHVLATLATGVGLAVESGVWFVPVVVAGTITSIELAAAADRTTVIRPKVPGLRSVGAACVGSMVLSATVLVVGQITVVAASGAVIVAAAAGVLATRVIAR